MAKVINPWRTKAICRDYVNFNDQPVYTEMKLFSIRLKFSVPY